jgi:hypothetical protein
LRERVLAFNNAQQPEQIRKRVLKGALARMMSVRSPSALALNE